MDNKIEQAYNEHLSRASHLPTPGEQVVASSAWLTGIACGASLIIAGEDPTAICTFALNAATELSEETN